MVVEGRLAGVGGGGVGRVGGAVGAGRLGGGLDLLLYLDGVVEGDLLVVVVDGPVGALARVVLGALDPCEALVQRQIVPDRVLPAVGGYLVEAEVVRYPLLAAIAISLKSKKEKGPLQRGRLPGRSRSASSSSWGCC